MQQLMSLGECLFTIVAFVLVVFGVWRAWVPHHMSSTEPTPAPTLEADTVPILGTDTNGGTNEVVLADTNAVSRYMSDIDIIALLSVIRKENNEYRYSANNIYRLVGGNHNEVLDTIRSLRNTGTRYVSDMIREVTQEVQSNGN